MPDDVLRVETQFDGAPIQAGMQEMASTTTSATSEMSAGFQEVAESSDAAAEAMTRLERAEAMATGKIAGMTAGAGGLGGALSRVAAQSETLGPILQALFPIALAIAFVDIVIHMAEEVRKAAESFGGWDAQAKAAYEAAIKDNDKYIEEIYKLKDALAESSQIGKQGLERTSGEMDVQRQKIKNLTAETTEFLHMQQQVSAEVDKQNTTWTKLTGWLTGATDELDRMKKRAQELTEITSEDARKQMEAAQKLQDDAKRNAEEAIKIAREVAEAQIAGRKSIQDAMFSGFEADLDRQKKAFQISADDEAKEKEANEILKYQLAVDGVNKQIVLAQQEGTVKKAEVVKLQAELEAMEVSHKARIRAIRENAANEDARDREKWEEEDNRRSAEMLKKDIEDQIARTHAIEENAVSHAERMVRMNAQQAAETEKVQLGGGFFGGGAAVKTAQEAFQQQTAYINQAIAAADAYKASLVAIGVAASDPKMLEAEREKTRLIDMQTEAEFRFHRALDAIAAKQREQLDKMTAAFNSNIVSWINGSESFGRAMQKVWTNLADTAISAMLKIAEQMIVGMILHRTIADQEKLDSAKTAAAHTYASVSGIPVIGWALAPAAAAAAFVAVEAFEQGGIVGEDQMAMVHKNEMVLPANISRGVQQAFAGGGEGGGGGTQHVHFSPSIHAMDAAGVDRVLNEHEDKFVAMMLRVQRKRNF